MMNRGAARKREAIEPFWPSGSVAHIYIDTNARTPVLQVEELAISRVVEGPTGWRVEAEGNIFDVDEQGESADCVPWDEMMEMQYGKTQGLEARAAAHKEAEADAALEVDFGL